MTAAHFAIIAAQHLRKWGFDAAQRYAAKRGVSDIMFLIAVSFEQRRSFRNV